MKNFFPLLSVTVSMSVIITVLTSCRQYVDPTSSAAPESVRYTYYPFSASTTDSGSENESAPTESSAFVDDRTNTTAAERTAVPEQPSASYEPETTAAATEPETETAATQPSAENSTIQTSEAVQSTEKASESSTAASKDVDLSIVLPSANGDMEVDTSPGNKFIAIVNNERQIDTSYLAAVYSVPDSGQNYVFEFSSSTGRTADDLRRVYLIDTNGKITGVAAKNASEKENVSSVENWFCMNVLIKKLVFPAVENELQ